MRSGRCCRGCLFSQCNIGDDWFRVAGPRFLFLFSWGNYSMRSNRVDLDLGCPSLPIPSKTAGALESTGIILVVTRDGVDSTGYLRFAESPCAEKENVPEGRGKGLCEGWRGEGTNASLISSVYESIAM